MKRAVLVLALVSCKSDPAPIAAPADPPAQVGPRHAFVAAGEGSVEDVVKSEVARAEGKRVVVYVGATWCEPCRRFHEAATAGKLDQALPPIRFVEFDLDRDGERLETAGYRSKYIPLFALPGSDGRASGKQIEGSIKGDGAAGEIAPRLAQLLR